MRGVFDDEEFEHAQHRHDPELTLGAGTLLAIFFGLVLVCALCFGFGYAVGRHGSATPEASLQPGTQLPLQASGSRAKPSATPQAPAPQPASQPQSTASISIPVVSAQSSAPEASPASQPQVHSALAPAASTAPPAAAPPVQPALPPAPLLVQIAAVANPEDALVLVNALKKRGYAVTARREPEDGLIHVRIGPFNGREEANRWRQKLLNDGYNAIVMQ